MRLKRMTDPTRPVIRLSVNKAAMTHHARIRALMFATVARPDGLVARRCRTHPATEAITSNTPMPDTSQPIGVCSHGIMNAPAVIRGPAGRE